MKIDQSNMIFGIRAVLEALDAGREFEKVLLRKGNANSDIMDQLRARMSTGDIPYQYVPVEKLNSITRKNHQGVIAFLSAISYSEISYILPRIFEEGRVPLILVIDQVSDVRNFGAIARTAEFGGVDAIVIPFRGSATINADAVKTSAGALHTIPVCRVQDMKQLMVYLKESGLQIFAADEKAEQSLYEANFDVPAAIILGSEDRGISPALKQYIDFPLSIPRKGKISSLNVSVAAGVFIFEVLRQRLK